MRRLRSVIGVRLGRCGACMRTSARVSAIAWLGYVFFRWLDTSHAARFALGMAIAATALLTLHLARWAWLRGGGQS